jgi:gentisate 1,2-dioxygenase
VTGGDPSADELTAAGLVPRRSRYPVTGFPQVRWPWQAVRAALARLAAGAPADTPVTLRYVDPTSGRAPLPTMGAEAHWLRPGERTRGERRTTSRIFHVIEGRGQSRVGEAVLAWEAGDTFVAPPWHWLEHEQRGEGPACLFQFDDEPVMQALGLWQEEAR